MLLRQGAVRDRWRRELDLADAAAIEEQLDASDIDPGGFRAFLAGEGRVEHDRIRSEAEERGIFGVPSFVVGDQLYFGNERLPLILEALEKGRA